MLVEVCDDRAPAFHRRVHAGVVRAQPLFEERRKERAVHELIEHRGVGQIPHEVNLPVENCLQLLEPHHERVVEARVLVQRSRDVHRVGLSRSFEQIAEPAVERNANLVSHPEGEHGQLGPLETLGIQQRPGTEQLDDIRTNGHELSARARDYRSKRARPPAATATRRQCRRTRAGTARTVPRGRQPRHRGPGRRSA